MGPQTRSQTRSPHQEDVTYPTRRAAHGTSSRH
jgi:hypothetical protein